MKHGSLLSVVIGRSVVRVYFRQTGCWLREIRSHVIWIDNARNMIFGSKGSVVDSMNKPYFLGVSFNKLIS